MLTAPRPDYLATAEERIALEKIGRLEQAPAASGAPAPDEIKERISRLRGLLLWNISTEYDQRLTDAYKNLLDLNEEVDRLQKQYKSFVRTRQAATQSYEGYDDVIRRERNQIASAQEKVKVLMARQGSMLETMAVNELTRRRSRSRKRGLKAGSKKRWRVTNGFSKKLPNRRRLPRRCVVLPTLRSRGNTDT